MNPCLLEINKICLLIPCSYRRHRKRGIYRAACPHTTYVQDDWFGLKVPVGIFGKQALVAN